MYIELLLKLFDKSVNKIVFWKLSTFTDQNNLLDASFKFVWENKGKLVKTESWSEMVGNYPDLIGKAFSQSMLQNSDTEQWFRFFKQTKNITKQFFFMKIKFLCNSNNFPYFTYFLNFDWDYIFYFENYLFFYFFNETNMNKKWIFCLAYQTKWLFCTYLVIDTVSIFHQRYLGAYTYDFPSVQ